MSYALIVAEVRRGTFEDRNLDAIGLSHLLKKDVSLLVPDSAFAMNEKLVSRIIKASSQETTFLNPLNMAAILEKVMGTCGKPDVIIFTHSSAGTELASYAAGRLMSAALTLREAYSIKAIIRTRFSVSSGKLEMDRLLSQ